MKLLFVNQFYLPDKAATAQILGDVVEVAARWGEDAEESALYVRGSREEKAATAKRGTGGVELVSTRMSTLQAGEGDSHAVFTEACGVGTQVTVHEGRRVGVVCGRVGYVGNGGGQTKNGEIRAARDSAGMDVHCGGENSRARESARGTVTHCPRGENDNSPRVIRVGSGRFGHRYARKMLSYAGFYVGAARAVLMGETAEVVVTMTTPPLLGLVGWAAQAARGSKHVIWEMDVYPDVAVGLGTFKKGGLMDRFTGWLADTARRKADGVIVLGQCMARLMESRGVAREKIWICENWADGAEISPQRFHGGEELRVLYSGNLGLAHDVETIVGAVGQLGDGYRLKFCGGGPRRSELQNRLARMGWITFEGYEERGNLTQRLGWADVGLVTQRAETVGMVVPSKAYGIMAAGRGVLYVGPAESEVGRMVEREGTGWRVANGDSNGLAELLARLKSDRSEVEQAGKRAREVFERKYSMQEGVGRVLGAIERCTH